MSRREQIKMSDEEVFAFLSEERTLTCATAGPRGWPHLMPLWYVLREVRESESEGKGESEAKGKGESEAKGESESEGKGEGWSEAKGAGPRLWSWTYAASQKVRNIERDPRATLQVEAGELYHELRGVMMECEVVLHREVEDVAACGREIFARFASPRGQPPAKELPEDVGQVVAAQAAKRVALEFVELRRASWDHRKLGGVY